jgi:hypothetical protein
LRELHYLRWKVAYDLNGRWEVYRHDGQQPWYVGAADTHEAAQRIMESDRRYWLQQPDVIESRGPQSYAIPGVWS